MQKEKVFRIFNIIMLIFLLFSVAMPINLGSDLRLVNDYFDRQIYFERGSWWADSQIPYKETFIEYPQIALLIMTVPYLLIPGEIISLEIYVAIFSLLMMLVFFFTYRQIYILLGDGVKQRALLLFLPASLYFSYNRFDILVVLFTVLSLWTLRNEKYDASAVLLALGTFTKWYPALLLPIYLAYYHSKYKVINLRMILLYTFSSLIILLPTLITGGLEAVLAPIVFHLQRPLHYLIGILPILSQLFRFTSLGESERIVFNILLLLQFIGVPLVVFSKIDNFEKVLKSSLTVILFFVYFSKFYSPQWILWLSPYLVLLARDIKDLVWIVAADIFTYLTFPIGFYLAQDGLMRLGYFVPLFLVLTRYMLVTNLELWRNISTRYLAAKSMKPHL